MKKLFCVMAILLISLPLLASCGSNPGPSVSREYDITDFTNVKVSSAFEVKITPSDTYSISVTAPQNWFENINVERSGNVLEVSLDWGWNFWRHLGSNRPSVKITMPELYALEMSGATQGNVSGFQSAHDLKVSLSGASTLDLSMEAYDTSLTVSGASQISGQLKVHDVRLNVSGASNANLDGTANNMNLQVSGASHATLDDLIVKDVRAEVSGASHALVSPTGNLDIFVSGASTLEYTGNPVIGTLDITGASTVNRK